MLRNETTFIIGAGASYDFDFPLGDGLRNQIVDFLTPIDPNTSVNFRDDLLTQLLRDRCVREVGQNRWHERMQGGYQRAASIIRAGLPFARSIDTFLDGLRDEPEVEFLGKLAIATLIARAESASPLSPIRKQAANSSHLPAQRQTKLLASWHTQLSQILFEGHTRDTVESVFDKVSFVIFNYDRCIEEFLTTSLMNRFAIERHRALASLKKCRIIHPYGQVGAFFPNEEGHVPFGNCEGLALPAVASGIRTFTESMEEQIGAQVKDSVAGAETLVFMGFGWLPQNMELLSIGERKAKAKKVFVTAKGMPEGEIDVVGDQIARLLGRGGSRVQLNRPINGAHFIHEQGDCKALMANCWIRLTSA